MRTGRGFGVESSPPSSSSDWGTFRANERGVVEVWLSVDSDKGGGGGGKPPLTPGDAPCLEPLDVLRARVLA